LQAFPSIKLLHEEFYLGISFLRSLIEQSVSFYFNQYFLTSQISLKKSFLLFIYKIKHNKKHSRIGVYVNGTNAPTRRMLEDNSVQFCIFNDLVTHSCENSWETARLQEHIEKGSNRLTHTSPTFVLVCHFSLFNNC
jgi:hypothetical protein